MVAKGWGGGQDFGMTGAGIGWETIADLVYKNNGHISLTIKYLITPKVNTKSIW